MTAGCPKSIYSAQGGPNISSDYSILCNNSIDDKFLYRPSSVTLFTTSLFPAMTSSMTTLLLLLALSVGL